MHAGVAARKFYNRWNPVCGHMQHIQRNHQKNCAEQAYPSYVHHWAKCFTTLIEHQSGCLCVSGMKYCHQTARARVTPWQWESMQSLLCPLSHVSQLTTPTQCRCGTLINNSATGHLAHLCLYWDMIQQYSTDYGCHPNANKFFS